MAEIIAKKVNFRLKIVNLANFSLKLTGVG